jgi:methylmalonyl-CoA decarboxylase
MTSTVDATVFSTIKENIGIITLSNPRKKNALSKPLLHSMVRTLADFESQRIPVAIIRADEDIKVWSAGHDVAELQARRDPLGYYDALEEALRAIQNFHGPVIAMVQGGVWGGACDLVLTCDIVIADDTSTFAITPVKLGIPYNVSGIQHFINRVGMNIAKEMFFTAEPVASRRAKELGIINHLVSSSDLEEFTMTMALKIASHSSLSISVIKAQFRLLSNGNPIAPETFEMIQGLRRKVYDSHDYAEGIKAFMEKRAPVFTGE